MRNWMDLVMKEEMVEVEVLAEHQTDGPVR